MQRRTWCLAVAMASFAFGGDGVAQGASEPRAVTVLVKCQLTDVAGSPSSKVACRDVSGWFAGRLQWKSGGTVLFEEKGPFYGSHAGDDLVMVFLDGNGSASDFEAFYESPQSSIFAAPDLSFELFKEDNHGALVSVTTQSHMPTATALWCKHSEDTVQLAADIAADIAAGDAATLQAARLYCDGQMQAEATTRTAADTALQINTDNEAAARVAADITLQTNIDGEAAARVAADITLQTNIDDEAAARVAGDAATLATAQAYAYSKSEADGRFVQLGPPAAQVNSANPMVFLDNTSGSNMLTLRRNGVDAFTLSEAGDGLAFANPNGNDKIISTSLSRLLLRADTSINVMLDADNDATNTEFAVRRNGLFDAPNQLFRVSESGDASVLGTLTATSFVGSGANLTGLEAGDISSGTLAVVRGGTGLGTTPTAGRLLIGNGVGYTLNSLTAGTGVSVTNGTGTITITNTGDVNTADDITSLTQGAGIGITGTGNSRTITNIGDLNPADDITSLSASGIITVGGVGNSRTIGNLPLSCPGTNVLRAISSTGALNCVPSGADNLGNHTATLDLNMSGYSILSLRSAEGSSPDAFVYHGTNSITGSEVFAPYNGFGALATGLEAGLVAYNSASGATATLGSADRGIEAYGPTYGGYFNGISYGVYAHGGTYGVYGSGVTYGVYATSGDAGVYATGSSKGVYGEGGLIGVMGKSGVYGVYANGGFYGVFSESSDSGGYFRGVNYGVHAVAQDFSGMAVDAENLGSNTHAFLGTGWSGIDAKGTTYGGTFFGSTAVQAVTGAPPGMAVDARNGASGAWAYISDTYSGVVGFGPIYGGFFHGGSYAVWADGDSSGQEFYNRNTGDWMKSVVSMFEGCGGCSGWSGVSTGVGCNCDFWGCADTVYACLIAR